jgi:hypothetical protein
MRKQAFLNKIQAREEFFARVAIPHLDERNKPMDEEEFWEFEEYLWELLEAILIAIYHSVERQMKSMMRCRKEKIETERIRKWQHLDKTFKSIGIDLHTLDSYSQFNAIRLLVNSIKHNGEPSAELIGILPLNKQFIYDGLLTNHHVRGAFVKIIRTHKREDEESEHGVLLQDVLFHCRCFLTDIIERMRDEDLTSPSHRGSLLVGRRLKESDRK